MYAIVEITWRPWQNLIEPFAGSQRHQQIILRIGSSIQEAPRISPYYVDVKFNPYMRAALVHKSDFSYCPGIASLVLSLYARGDLQEAKHFRRNSGSEPEMAERTAISFSKPEIMVLILDFNKFLQPNR